MAKGKLIVIEGPDGAGKTTLCKAISDRLVISNNSKCEIYSLPNKRSFGYRKMREMLTKVNTPTDILQSIMIVNMQELLTKQIKKDLEDNTSVILDRWLISTIIYNTLNKGKLVDDMSTKSDTNKKLILDKISSDYCHIPIYPDYIFYLDIPKEVILKHAKLRNSKEIIVQKLLQKFMIYINLSIMLQHIMRSLILLILFKKKIRKQIIM